MNSRMQNQRGVTMLVVMILMTVMLMGALAMARHLEAATSAAGNAAYRDSALQASEVGLSTAFQAVRNLAADDESAQAGSWYWPTTQAVDPAGLPQVNWANAPEVTVGNNSVRYVVERVCSVAAVTDPLRECLVRLPTLTSLNSAREQDDKLDPTSSRQFRITVRVVGPKGTTAFVQSLITKG